MFSLLFVQSMPALIFKFSPLISNDLKYLFYNFLTHPFATFSQQILTASLCISLKVSSTRPCSTSWARGCSCPLCPCCSWRSCWSSCWAPPPASRFAPRSQPAKPSKRRAATYVRCLEPWEPRYSWWPGKSVIFNATISSGVVVIISSQATPPRHSNRPHWRSPVEIAGCGG